MRRTAKFGYTVDSIAVQIVEKEAAVITEIYADYLSGILSTTKIAKKLNQQSLRYHEDGQEWKSKTVSRVLKDRSYIGDADYPQIIDEVIFEKVQELLDSRVHRMPEEEAPYAEMFKEKMRCPVCGSLIKRNAWKKGDNEKIIMRCSNKECEGYKVLTRQIDIEAYIKNIFARVIENEEILEPPPPDVCELSKDDNMIKMTNELRFMMQDQNVAESDIIKSIQEIASERFNAYTSSDNTVVTELIKEKILESKAQSRIKAETIGEVVQRILLAPDRTVTVKLKNGIEFVGRME